MKSIFFLLVPVLCFSQVKLERIALLNNKVSLLAPAQLKKMTDGMWTLKYQKRARPMLVLTDKEGAINLIGDLTQQKVPDDQLAAFKDFQLAQLRKSKPGLKIIQEGVKTVNGKKVGYFKFTSGPVDQEVFNYYFFTVVDGRILFFTFNCMEKFQSAWEKTADQVVASLIIK